MVAKDVRGVISGIAVPLELTVLACMGSIVAGAWLSHWRTMRHLDPRRDPLRGLLRPENLRPAVDLAVRRDAQRRVSNAVLRGRIDQLATSEGGWSPDNAEAVRAHVAAVMRVGLRRQDRIRLEDGAFFSIDIPGADERAAVRIAERLRRALDQLSLPQFGPGARLTLSFGVAVDRAGEGRDGLELRARNALDAAVAQGTDLIVPASDIEDIPLLPAPSPATGPVISAA